MKRIVADKFIMLGDFHFQNPYVKNEQIWILHLTKIIN